MKYILFLLFFFSTFLVSFAQTPSFGTLEILTTASRKADKNNAVQVYFNGKLITAIQLSEKLVYRFYSKGRISMTFIENHKVKSKVVNISHDSTYYFLYGRQFKRITEEDWNTENLSYQLITKSQASKITCTNVINMEEDRQNPIGKLPNSFYPKQGSGFLLNSKGYILTNQHVIDGAKKVTVSGINGEQHLKINADVVAIDLQNDLALLKINSSLITFASPPYSIVKSTNTNQGDNIFALGYPIKEILGSEIKVTNGIINSSSGYKGSLAQFQFSAAIQPGNSGGPLLNTKGEIIGIVTSKLSPEKIESVGYATKSDYILTFLGLIKEFEIDAFSKTESITNLSLSEQVQVISKFVYTIETE